MKHCFFYYNNTQSFNIFAPSLLFKVLKLTSYKGNNSAVIMFKHCLLDSNCFSFKVSVWFYFLAFIDKFDLPADCSFVILIDVYLATFSQKKNTIQSIDGLISF